MYCPVLGSRSSSVSKKGSYCRCSGRAMVQKRLLSVNPAEPKIMRWTLASCANAGVGAVIRVEISTTRSPSTKRTHTDNMGLINVKRLIRHLLGSTFFRGRVLADLTSLTRVAPPWPALRNKGISPPFPRKDCLRSLALPLYVFTLSTPSQHCTHAVTFPSETIALVPYAKKKPW